LKKTAELQNGGMWLFFQTVSVTGIVAGKTVTKKLAYETFIEWKIKKKEKKKIDNLIVRNFGAII